MVNLIDATQVRLGAGLEPGPPSAMLMTLAMRTLLGVVNPGGPVPAATREKEVLHLDADDVPYYEDWLADDLREELVSRGLTKSGKKDELVARLYADDEETGA